MLTINDKEVFTTLGEIVDPRHTALVLIDMQNDYVSPGGYSDKLGEDTSALREIISPIRRVLDAARDHGMLVIHVQMTFYPNCLAESPAALRRWLLRVGYKTGDSLDKLPGRLIEGTWGWQIVDVLRPLANEIVVKKHRASAFVGTDLDLILRSNGTRSLVIAGVVTQGCVLGTAKDAIYFDYCPVPLRDCIATRERTIHDAALLIMSKDMDVVESGDVLATWASMAISPKGLGSPG